MRVPISWLREYVDVPDDAQTIADRLAMLGFPVDDIEQRPPISGVVVGTIVALAKHPNADRLQICTVDIGGDKPLTIATAATNVAAGQVIPVATIGARLPHLTIEPRKMRGIDSEGMLCSPDELALPAEWFEDGIMQLDASTPLGRDVVEFFGLADAVLDVEVTSNRVDAMSVIGLARELAASYGVSLRLPTFENPGRNDAPPGLAPRVVLDSPDCTRFIAQRFDHVAVAAGPAWMRIRLALAGQRPINNIVDISNYVMLETAQPLHFYDAARVLDARFFVRDAHADEPLEALDDAKHSLTPQALVIADSNAALGLAGLMGGKASAVRDDTTAILLESANFNGARIRRMSMQLGFRSEASSRHEKTLAPALADIGAARAAELLVRQGAHAYRPQIFGAALEAATPIALCERDVERLLGVRISPARIAQHLEALGCTVTRAGTELSVVAPAWRRDLLIPADLVEEVARMEGYDNIEAVVPSVPAHTIDSAQFDLEERLADCMASLGYNELMTYSLHGAQVFEHLRRAGLEPSHKPVEVRNPLSEDQRYLRYGMGPALIEHLARADAPTRVFEIGHTFTSDEGHVAEIPVLTFGFSSEPAPEQPWRDSGFLRIRSDAAALIRRVTGRDPEVTRDVRNALHPGKTAVLILDGREIASLGRLDPRVQSVYAARLPQYFCNIYLDQLPDYATPRYHAPSRYPSTYRDLALIVDLEVSAARLEALVSAAAGDGLIGVRVFDEYRGPQVDPNKKSLAVRVTIGRNDATITDAEADAIIACVLAALQKELGAVLRA